MKTININIYSFNELSEEAKETAMEQVRQRYYENNDYAKWAIDDCSLLEPLHTELEKLFRTEYNFPLIKNNRKVYFSLDRGRYIDISQAMEITNEQQFLTWLGLKESLKDKVSYTIQKDTIEFYSYEDLTEEEEECLSEATSKFEDHCSEILNRIEVDYDYRFTDEAIIEDIEANEMEFLIDGSLYS